MRAPSARAHPARPRQPSQQDLRTRRWTAGWGRLGRPDLEGTVFIFSHPLSPLPLSGSGAAWPGPAPSRPWACVSASVTGTGADPSRLQRAMTDRWEEPQRRPPPIRPGGRGVCAEGAGCSRPPKLLSRAGGGAAPEASRSPCSLGEAESPHSGSPCRLVPGPGVGGGGRQARQEEALGETPLIGSRGPALSLLLAGVTWAAQFRWDHFRVVMKLSEGRCHNAD